MIAHRYAGLGLPVVLGEADEVDDGEGPPPRGRELPAGDARREPAAAGAAQAATADHRSYKKSYIKRFKELKRLRKRAFDHVWPNKLA